MKNNQFVILSYPKAKIGDGAKLKEVHGVTKQIIANLENLPQLVLLVSFLFISLSDENALDLYIVPDDEGAKEVQLYWIAFILSLFMSCYSALSSFMDTTTVSTDEKGCCAKIILFISFALQIASRIGPVAVICIIKIDCDTTDPGSVSLIIVLLMILIPLFCRWFTFYCIFKCCVWSGDELISFSDKILNILANTFIVSPVKNWEISSKHLAFVFGTCLVDAWIFISFSSGLQCLNYEIFIYHLPFCVGGSFGGLCLLWLYHKLK